ncbi:LysR family transcriptional regulator [Aeromonas rivipollensis]|uniref:LysR family transcriptional regulator n=1 Tax=Aeromonas rivipollensis TaxID=948519 RepID=A0ABX0D0C8_9GAMM|nr:LysR family transcriptional regulator [Aeromonas rivipollensis]NEX89686.1 LysR family transcriptional regulator [Aeromonas rivipollensis]NEY07823.1 LysR family transcriptional regulator [Aeromonas rivipollensis]
MLDLRLLRFFIAIYEEKNITAAAARCHVSQPSLSAGLRQLEEALGDSLFIRGKKGVEAKDPAHYLYPHAVKLVEEARRLPTLFRQKATRARLNIAIMPDLSRRRVAGLLQRVQGVLPELDLTLSDYGTPADCRLTLDALRREDEIFLPLWEENYVLCVPAGHPLAGRERLPLAELQHYDFIECPPCEAHQQTIGLLACDRLTLNLVAKAESKGLVMALVLAGVGISFLPDGLVEDEPGLRTVAVNGPRMFRRIGLCYPAHQTLNPALRDLIPELASRGAS